MEITVEYLKKISEIVVLGNIYFILTTHTVDIYISVQNINT